MEKTMKQKSHILIFPFPAQGHVKGMLSLAQLISHVGLHVTFLNTEHNHRRLVSHRQELSERFPTLQFAAIPDGLPADHPRLETFMVSYLFASFGSVAKPLLHDFLLSQRSSETRPPVTSIISDAIIVSPINDVVEDLGIRIFTFSGFAACAFWAFFSVPKLVENGELPFSDDEMDRVITGIPGMDGILRIRDLPYFTRFPVSHPTFDIFENLHRVMTRTSGLILNSSNELEGSVVDHIAPHFLKIYTIGPVHALLRRRLGHNDLDSSTSHYSSSGNFWKEDRSCMTWLDSQPPRSVIYVSFGSIAAVTSREVMEFWHGLVNSKKRFLWAVRSDTIVDGVIPDEIQLGSKENGLLVDWAPQEEVLAHSAIGGFLTHSGWNSTAEGIVAGVPMICWPILGDHQVNSRWVSEVWKIGLDMKDTCDRSTVEKMIKLLMEDRRDEIMNSMDKISKLARQSVSQGGSSYNNLDKLIEDLKII